MQVRLIGYCVEGSLFLVYEFVDNGNLSQHLRGSSGENNDPSSKRKARSWLNASSLIL